MQHASLIFVPGLSGLSINHSFLYGRPYITCESNNHGPEIDFIENNVNGYIIKKNITEFIKVIESMITDRAKLETLCANAFKKGEDLSVSNWIKKIKSSIA